jgi:hypothetical protein
MTRLSSTSTASVNLSTAQTIATIAAPDSGSAYYLVKITISGLNSGHVIRPTETQGSVVIPSPDQASGGTVLYLEFAEVLTAGDTSVVIKVEDTTDLSTAATVLVEVYNVYSDLSATLSSADKDELLAGPKE